MVCATGQSGTAADRKHLFSQSEAALHWELRRERRAQREHPVPKNGVYGLCFSQPSGGSQDSCLHSYHNYKVSGQNSFHCVAVRRSVNRLLWLEFENLIFKTETLKYKLRE